MATATLNRKLNVVFSVETDKGKVYVHSTPVSRQIFEDNFLVMSRTLTATYKHELGPAMGPAVAALLLKQEAKAVGGEVELARVTQSFIGEVRRLTNVIYATEGKGWESLPFSVAVQRGVLDDDSAAEVENSIVYFMCASALHRKAELSVVLDGLKAVWSAETTSFNATEYMRSLPTLTPVANTGEKPTATPSSTAA
jgi:hypothetical protein